MVDDAAFPGRLHFVGHAVRDIINRLPFVLDGELQNSRVEYAAHLDLIAPLWQSPDLFQPTDTAPVTIDTVSVSVPVARQINELVKQHRASRKRDRFGELIQRLPPNGSTRAPIDPRVTRQFKSLHDWFMRHTHLRETTSSTTPEDALRARFDNFERLIHCYVGQFFTAAAALDDILQQANK